MNDQRLGGLALLFGALGIMLTMLNHPTGRDLSTASDFDGAARLALVVHACAIASTILSFLGSIVLTRALDEPRRLAWIALVVSGFASVCVVFAAVASGWIGPEILRALRDADETTRPATMAAQRIVHGVNQALAGLFVVGSSIAVSLWSAAMIARRRAARITGYFGLAVGIVSAAGYIAGHVRLDVHGFGLLVFAQAVWWIATGVQLARGRLATAST